MNMRTKIIGLYHLSTDTELDSYQLLFGDHLGAHLHNRRVSNSFWNVLEKADYDVLGRIASYCTIYDTDILDHEDRLAVASITKATCEEKQLMHFLSIESAQGKVPRTWDADSHFFEIVTLVTRAERFVELLPQVGFNEAYRLTNIMTWAEKTGPAEQALKEFRAAHNVRIEAIKEIKDSDEMAAAFVALVNEEKQLRHDKEIIKWRLAQLIDGGTSQWVCDGVEWKTESAYAEYGDGTSSIVLAGDHIVGFTGTYVS